MTFKVPENVAVSDSGFLFMASTGETFTLNETGKMVFNYIQSGLTEHEIAEKIVEEFDVEITSFERDLSDFIIQLKNYSLVNEK
jgi:hypothetical protein